MMKDGQPRVGVAWYRKDQWDDLLRVSDDRSALEDTYGEWLFEAHLVLRRLREQGIDATRVDVDVEDLVRWSKERGLRITAQTRASYVAEKLEKGHFEGV